MLLVALLASFPLLTASQVTAQPGNPGAGETSMGSKGFEWQAEQALAKEELATFRAEMERLSEDMWFETALASVRFELAEDQLLIDEAIRVGGAVADKKAKTEETEYFRRDDPSWIVRFGKKRPGTLTLELTDDNSTKVKCSVRSLEDLGSGYVGVFLNKTELHCFARADGSSDSG